MAELLSPGVFIEEVPSSSQVVGTVSTSNMGIVSWTPQGPTNEATLITSFDTYVKTFGTFDRRSYGAYSVAAFFANGGRRCYVVRVVPTDSVSATCKIQSQTTAQVLETGDGVTAAHTKTLTTSLLKDNSSASPIVPGSLTISWRGKAVVQTDVATTARNGVTALQTAAGVLGVEGRLTPGTLPSIDANLLAVTPDGTVEIKWLSGAASKSVTISAPASGSTVGTGTNVAGSIATLDYRTGIFSLLIIIAETPDAAGAVTATYFPATATHSVTDDALGGLPAGSVLTGAGTVDYSTGAYSFTTNAATYLAAVASPIIATYKINAWALAPVSPGIWGNDLKVKVAGSDNYFTALTQSFTRYNVAVLKTDSDGVDVIQEAYEDLVFDDAESKYFWADIVNEFSNLVSVTTPGGDEAPGELSGNLNVLGIAGGNGLSAGQIIQVTLPNATVAKRSLVITYTSNVDSTTKTITDDGQGNLSGDVDATYAVAAANTVVYTTGVVDVKTSVAIKGGTVVVASYRTAPTETVHTESFGDTDKDYTEGEDGTFDTTNFGRAVFTSPVLAPDYEGLYALDRVEELMQVIVPDFAGDTTVTGDLLDYAALRAGSSSGGDRFIILTVPKGSSATEAVDWFRNRLVRFSNYAALYWPWINIADPLVDGRKLTMPPLGHIAGIYARTDVTRNVGKAPGGTIDGALNFLTGLETNPTQGERDVVYPNRINPLISSPQTGLAVWGVRTISQDSTWKYVNSRRLFMFLEKSIFNSTFWIVFENNGPGLWVRIKAQITGFLLALFNDGYFAGTTPDQAFFVTVDETNNSSATIDQGQVIIDVGVAVNKPAEFVRFRFQQKSVS